MTENRRIEGKFYPLQHSEWLRACHELTPAQRDVLYYLRTLDPYSNGLDISPASIARALSSDTKEVHRSTVGRALKVLEEKGFVDLEMLEVRIHVLPQGFHCCEECNEADEASELPQRNKVASAQPERSLRNQSDRQATKAIATQQPEPETPTTKQSCPPKINKTYKDFKDSLSEDEREKFLNFAREKTKHFSRPVANIQDYLASKERWRDFYQEFRAQQVKTQEEDWRSHPQFLRALEIMRLGIPRFKVKGHPELNLTREERFSMAEFALKNQLVWGAET